MKAIMEKITREKVKERKIRAVNNSYQNLREVQSLGMKDKKFIDENHYNYFLKKFFFQLVLEPRTNLFTGRLVYQVNYRRPVELILNNLKYFEICVVHYT